MLCHEYQNKLADLLDGTLSPALREAFLAHARNCTQCAAELQAYRTLISEANALPRLAAPDHLWHGIEAALDAPARKQTATARRARRLIPHGPLLKLAAAAAIFALGLWFGRMPFGGAPPGVHSPALNEFTQLNSRAAAYLEKSRVLLLGIINLDEMPGTVFDLRPERHVSRQLLREATSLRAELPAVGGADLKQLFADLEVILLEIANLEQQTDFESIELLRAGVAQKDLLLKINLSQLRERLVVPPDENSQNTL